MNQADQCKDYVKKSGWTKHTIQDSDGKVCMLGSVIHSSGVDWNRHTPFDWYKHDDFLQLLSDIILEQYPDRRHNLFAIDNVRQISFFNDHESTDFNDVETIFEKASVRLDELI